MLARKGRRFYGLRFRCLESSQKLLPRRVLLHQPARWRNERHIRSALPSTPETLAKKQIRRPDFPKLETRPSYSRDFGMHPEDESEPDNAQRSLLPFPGDPVGLPRGLVRERRRRDKRVVRTSPRPV